MEVTPSCVIKKRPSASDLFEPRANRTSTVPGRCRLIPCKHMARATVQIRTYRRMEADPDRANHPCVRRTRLAWDRWHWNGVGNGCPTDTDRLVGPACPGFDADAPFDEGVLATLRRPARGVETARGRQRQAPQRERLQRRATTSGEAPRSQATRRSSAQFEPHGSNNVCVEAKCLDVGRFKRNHLWATSPADFRSIISRDYCGGTVHRLSSPLEDLQEH